MNQQETRSDKGFTLVELLIVIVILGILATVTVFAVRGITSKAKDNSCQAEQRTIETAIEAFYADHQADATQLSDLVGDTAYLKQNPFASPGSGHFGISFAGGTVTLSSGTCIKK
jgi:general secretion pathway protein G